jgi:FixJ family two-component response regulator
MRKVIALVDDDESVRESLPALLEELGFTAQAFASAEEFLGSGYTPDCLILDIILPGMSGPGLQRELALRGRAIRTVFITALSEQSLPPGLLQYGAVPCLFKPFSENDLRTALDAALVP